MEYQYLKFDEEELDKLIEKYDLIEGNIENILKKVTDEYLENKISLGLFLQYINLSLIPIGKTRYHILVEELLRIIDSKKDVDINIYELLMHCYSILALRDKVIEVAENVIKKDKYNRMSLIRLVWNNTYIDFSYELSKGKLINNDFSYIGLFSEVLVRKIKNIKAKIKYGKTKNLNSFIDKYIYADNKNDSKIDNKKLLNECEELIKDFKILIEKIKIDKRDHINYMYQWGSYRYNHSYISINATQLNLASVYYIKYNINNDISDKNIAVKLYKEIIKNDKTSLNIPIKIMEKIFKVESQENNLLNRSIISLANIYLKDKDYESCENLLDDNAYAFNHDFYRIEGICTFNKNKSEDTARQAISLFQKYINEYKEYNPYNVDADVDVVLEAVYIMNEMKEFIDHDMDKTFLYDLYFYYVNNIEFQLYIIYAAIKIEYYELSYRISKDILLKLGENNQIISIYMIYSLYKLNQDNTKILINIFNQEDFNNYKLIISLINECAKSKVLKEDTDIKNKNVLIDIYEIMSNTRKELVVMRLFDYVRNADAYANKTFDKDMNEEITNKVAKWKGENINIKYNNKEYVLCYHFHSSNEIKKYTNGNIEKDNRGKPLRRLPDINWIAINQIRDSLAHRVNEKTSDVNEEIINAKKAREFINANFEYIIQCLFSVIIENNLLTDEQFRSDEF